MDKRERVKEKIQKVRVVSVLKNKETKKEKLNEEKFKNKFLKFKEKVEREGGIAKYIEKMVAERDKKLGNFKRKKWIFNEKRFSKREQWNEMTVEQKVNYLFDNRLTYLVLKGEKIDDERKDVIKKEVEKEIQTSKVKVPKTDMKEILAQRVLNHEKQMEEMKKRMKSRNDSDLNRPMGIDLDEDFTELDEYLNENKKLDDNNLL